MKVMESSNTESSANKPKQVLLNEILAEQTGKIFIKVLFYLNQITIIRIIYF